MTDETTAEERIAPAAEQQELAIVNEMMRRVHTVMANFASTMARGRPEQALSFDETRALINGATSGIAAFCAMMDIQPNPGRNPADLRTPEEFLGDLFRQQFINAFQEVRAQVAAATAESAAGGASKAN